MKTRPACTIAFMLCAPAAYAEDFVDRADANGDGVVSLYELRAAYYADAEFNKRIEQSFADYDANGDGSISAAERQAKRAASSETLAPALSSPPAPRDNQNTAISAAGSASVSPIESMATAEVVAPFTNEDPGERGGSSDIAQDEQRAASNDSGLSPTENWIIEIDSDNSGGASIAELVASGDGQQWFTDKAFESADNNGDGDLDPTELATLVSSLERRRR